MTDRSKEIVSHMMTNDEFSQWLGIQIVEVKPGSAILEMQVREEMTNGFKIAHGGITYSLADSALAFASNGYGIQAVSIETSISHTRPVKSGDTLKAVAVEKNRSRKVGIYEVTIENQDSKKVALFKGTVFYKDSEWPQNLAQIN
ncbi:MAG: hydroxyphenylacetyl-CoA thioesterase PaaI [Flavobacteriia bacterium]|nr:hydroxyphenylacetyl-CoA thioesterase PaaI [Flavobacteriia bacterium]